MRSSSSADFVFKNGARGSGGEGEGESLAGTFAPVTDREFENDNKYAGKRPAEVQKAALLRLAFDAQEQLPRPRLLSCGREATILESAANFTEESEAKRSGVPGASHAPWLRLIFFFKHARFGAYLCGRVVSQSRVRGREAAATRYAGHSVARARVNA